MSKFRVCVHRWITGILASAMVFTALPVNAFAEEVEVFEDDLQIVTEGENEGNNEGEGAGEGEENYAVTFATTGIESISYKVGEGAEQTWSESSEPVSVAKDSAFTITGITVADRYDADTVSVKVGEATIEKSGTSWSVGTISAATTVTVTAALSECNVAFTVDGIKEIKYTIGSGDEETWMPGYSVNPSVPNGQALVITGITVMEGYKADAVSVKDGETTITKSEDNKWTVGAITSDKTITVGAELKPGVTVTALVNDATPSAEVATVTLSGLDSENKTQGEQVGVSVTLASGMIVDEAKYMIGTSTPADLIKNSNTEFVVPQTAVLTATEQGNDITVNLKVINPDAQVYETKLGLNKKTTTFILGEGAVDWSKIDITNPETYKDTILLATAKYSSKTTVKKISKAEVITPDGYSYLDSGWGLLIVGDDIRMYGSDYLYTPGKYTLKVYPATPDGRSTKTEPATLTLTVKEPIYNIKLNNVPSKVYKAQDKAVTIKPTVTYNWGEKEYEPAVKKVTWELLDKDHNPVSSDKITIKNGTVTIAKDYTVSTTPADNMFFIKAKAADYTGNSVYEEAPFEVVSTTTDIESIVIGSVSDFSNPVFSSALLRKEIVVKDSKGNPVSLDDVTITSSDPKNFNIGSYSYYDEEKGEDVVLNYAVKKIEKAGKFTVTVTANDGSKNSFKQVIKVKEATPSSYNVVAFAYHDYGSSSVPITFDGNKVATLNEFPTRIYVLSEAVSGDSSVLVNNATLSVKGGKKISNGSNTKGKRWINVKPNSDKITITHKYGKGSSATNETYTINLAHSKIKVDATKKAYDIWDAMDQDFAFDFSVSGIDDATAGNYYLRFNFPESFPSKSESIYRSLIDHLNDAAAVSLTNDSSKFTLSGNLWRYQGFPKGTYTLNAALYKATETEDGPVYTAVSDSFVVKLKSSKGKAPSAAIDVSDRKPLEVAKESGEKALIGFKTFKNVRKENGKEKAIMTSSIKVYCNNKDGSVNKFTEFFDVIPVVKNGDKYDQATGNYAEGIQLVVKGTEGISEPKDLTGWVRYTVEGEDGNQSVEKLEKITVKFK